MSERQVVVAGIPNALFQTEPPTSIDICLYTNIYIYIYTYIITQ